jgi:hypothetical protein
VLATETTCPFCVAALPENLSDAIIPGTTQRLGRAAAFFFTASLAVAGCGGDVTTEPEGASGGTSGGATSGGATSGGTTSSGGTGGAGGGSVDAGPDDDGGGQTLYGLPIDAGMEEDGGPDDAGGGEPLYGAAPVDGGGGGSQ